MPLCDFWKRNDVSIFLEEIHIKHRDNWQAGQGTIQIYIMLRQIELCVLLSY